MHHFLMLKPVESPFFRRLRGQGPEGSGHRRQPRGPRPGRGARLAAALPCGCWGRPGGTMGISPSKNGGFLGFFMVDLTL